MEHAKGLTAITNPTTNSYHRLVPGYEAPVYIAWSSSNRSATIRIPGHFKGEKYAFMKRMEYRVPDPASNPYLVFSAVLAAGLDGIKKKIEPGDPVKEDIYKMTKSERKKHGIDTLPANLGRALDELESDRKYLNPIFSNEVLDKIIELERRDHREIAIRPHPHEFYLYFDVWVNYPNNGLSIISYMRNKEAIIIPRPPETIIVVNFWYFIPKKITMPPARPRKIESIPNNTFSTSAPMVRGVNIPESSATAATI